MHPYEQWVMDFMQDTLADGRLVRILTVLDLYSRECVVATAAPTFRGHDVAEVLSQVAASRGLPGRIRVDNGTEFTSKALDHWAYWHRVDLDFSRPGKPVDNTSIEAFNGTLRHECSSQHWFLSLQDVQRTLKAWRGDDNTQRPHSSLAGMPRAQFRAGGYFVPGRNRLQSAHA